MLILVPTALMALVGDGYRFLPGALVAGLLADVLVWRFPYGASRRTDAVIAFAIPAMFYAAYFVTLQLTGGIAWTIHLWLGAVVIAGVIGLVVDEAMRSPSPGLAGDHDGFEDLLEFVQVRCRCCRKATAFDHESDAIDVEDPELLDLAWSLVVPAPALLLDPEMDLATIAIREPEVIVDRQFDVSAGEPGQLDIDRRGGRDVRSAFAKAVTRSSTVGPMIGSCAPAESHRHGSAYRLVTPAKPSPTFAWISDSLVTRPGPHDSQRSLGTMNEIVSGGTPYKASPSRTYSPTANGASSGNACGVGAAVGPTPRILGIVGAAVGAGGALAAWSAGRRAADREQGQRRTSAIASPIDARRP